MTLRWPGLTKRRPALALILLAAALPARPAELMITEATALEFDVDAARGNVVTAMLGRLWLMPLSGGEAAALTPATLTLGEPRISPDGERVVASGTDGAGYRHLWLIDIGSGAATRLGDGLWNDTSAAWHPDGARIAFVSDRSGSLDVWEHDLTTGEEVRLTTAAGDETDPAWYPDGNRLLYVARSGTTWSLRSQFYRGRPQALLETRTRIAAPSIRPDGGVITFLADERPGGLTLKFLIPVREMAVKTLIAGRDPTAQPVRWLDTQDYLAALDGRLVRRTLAARGERDVSFYAWISIPEPAAVPSAGRPAPADAQPFPFVLRAGRVFDAISSEYRSDIDLLIANGRIETIAPRRDWGDAVIIDLGDATVLPGLIDVEAPAADANSPSGPTLLASGVTTMAMLGGNGGTGGGGAANGPRRLGASDAAAAYVDVRGVGEYRGRIEAIEAAHAAGRAVLTDRLLPDLTVGARLLAAGTDLPRSPAGRIYADVADLLGKSRAAVVSGQVARRGLPAAAWARLRSSRMFARIGGESIAAPAIADPAAPALNRILDAGGRLVAGSGPSPLPAGLSLHAELLSLQRDGLEPFETIRAATSDAAEALGLGGELGSIAEGRIADLIVVSGDPLRDVGALLDPIAIVLGGRFMSAASLLGE